MASIYKRNGIWQIQMRVPGKTKPVQKSLGKNCTEEKAQKELAKAIALEAEQAAAAVTGATIITVESLADAYLEWAKGYYKDPDGEPTSSLYEAQSVIRTLKKNQGRMLISAYGPNMLRDLREVWIGKKKTVHTVNAYTGCVKRIFKWGASREVASASVYHALYLVENIEPGRTEAKDSKEILPVPQKDIDAVRATLPRPLQGLIDLQLATGARGGELVILRPCDIDRKGKIWIARPTRHKNRWRGMKRDIYIGAKAQEALLPFLKRHPKAYLFSPVEAYAEYRKRRHEERKADPKAGNRPGHRLVENPKRKPGERYTPDSYRQAIVRACERLEIDTWTPHRLRHTTATRVREEFGLEASQVYLGEASMRTAEFYAEKNKALGIMVAERMG